MFQLVSHFKHSTIVLDHYIFDNNQQSFDAPIVAQSHSSSWYKGQWAAFCPDCFENRSSQSHMLVYFCHGWMLRQVHRQKKKHHHQVESLSWWSKVPNMNMVYCCQWCIEIIIRFLTKMTTMISWGTIFFACPRKVFRRTKGYDS